ncbi:hypothetical protein [Rickettsiella endosymbiont of Aleochara curtula]|uniref:hypothetical protein n=1 Tax=Rickettsiella endosymbiont of Aleochara curtula TaxID=3077936 RepID=UPI00313E5CA5
MPVLYEDLCESNQNFLREEGLVDNGENIVGLERRAPEAQRRIINQLIESEKLNEKVTGENYIKEKYKGKHIILLLVLALALLGVGFTLAPLLIVSTITIPILPVLLFGIAIVAITKFFLNIKNNRLETKLKDAANILNKLKEYKTIETIDEEVIRTFNHKMHEIKNLTEQVVEEISALEKNTSHNFSQLLNRAGLFTATPIPISPADPANEFHNQEARSPTPTHN